MSLRRKTLVIIGIALAGLIVLTYVASQVILLNGYRQLETQTIRKDANLFRNIVSYELRGLAQTAAFLAGSDLAFPETILTESFFEESRIDLILVLDENGQVVFEQSRETRPVDAPVVAALMSSDTLAQPEDADSDGRGLLVVEDMPVLAASTSVGAAGGTLIAVRYLEAEDIANLARMTQLMVDVRPYAATSTLPQDYQDAQRLLQESADNFAKVTESDTVYGYTVLNDVHDNPALMVRVTESRGAYGQSQDRFILLVVVLVVISLIFGLIVSGLLERMILSRLSAFNATLQQIVQEGDISARLRVEGDDNMAQLSTAFNTTLNKLEDAHREQRRISSHLNAVLDNLPAMLLITDLQANITQAGGLALKTLHPGDDDRDLSGKSIKAVFDGMGSGVERALSGETFHNTLELQGAQFDTWFVPLRERGEVKGAVVVALDVSENHRLQTTLREAQDAAEAAAHAKTTFLANMSHELRTPLNAIIGFTGIMTMNKALDEKDAYRAARIRANGERLLELIDDILDLSRIEAGRLTLIPVHVDVRQMVEDARTRYLPNAQEKGLDFHIRVEANLPNAIFADQDALAKIINNLVSNAVKFTEEGSVKVNVKGQAENLVIQVSDTGIGIPVHMHEIIFESFRQVDPSATRAYGGTGLGLALVHNLCQAMGGTISVDSAIGEGTVFTVRLPLIRKVQGQESERI